MADTLFIGIIPARYGSTRFPGKPLALINGKPMIQHVWEQSTQAKSLTHVAVATDDQRIVDAVQAFGGKALLTRTDHATGTDRCWEAYQQLQAELSLTTPAYVVNIQGDEPFIDPNQIDELTTILDGVVEIATQCTDVDSAEVLHNPDEVKIALTTQGEALYFSRQPIPFLRGVDPADWHTHYPYFRHVGLYAYRADILEQISHLPPSPLEKAESLEQLRWLEAGFRINVTSTKYIAQSVDSPSDIEKVEQPPTN
ncbi:3-deoxy-manno-octulosonate cytidylyltransferase [Spirosoma soli]|uniref:3-deoxy-manno-octulosonate cytidylyltransferase n=1 Tax=Spirosoma soli TaxID=1770529 RepID=A0ABW5LXG0_9BACT